MSDYDISDVEVHGSKIKIITRLDDKKGIPMNIVDLFIDLAHDHPEVAEPMVNMMFEMKSVKEFRSGVQA